MRIGLHYRAGLIFCLSSVLLLLFGGCRKSDTVGGATAATPKQAASQLQQVFVSADPQMKTTANVASESLRAANYEKAIQSLYTLKARGNLTLEQGIAVQGSMAALEATLIGAMNAGDPNAKRAWELLKSLNPN